MSSMSPALPRAPRRQRTGLLTVAAAAAALACLAACRDVGRAFVSAGSGPGARWARPGRTATARAAAETETDVIAAMDTASVYMTDVDPITAEMDLSTIPEDMGVYAIYDEDSKLQYIGLSRDIRKSIDGHANSIGPAEAGMLISSVKCLVMPDGSKEVLKATWERWIKDHMDTGGEIPPGNLPESAPGADPRWRTRKGGSLRQPLSLAGSRGITSIHEALDAVKDSVQKHPVLLFMKGTPTVPQCGFSAKTIGILREIGMPFDSVNVMDPEANPGVRDAVKEFSNWPTIPQLFVNGQLLGGADIVAQMYESGKLKETLQQAASGASSAGDASEADGGEAASYERGSIGLIDEPARPTATAVSRALKEQFDLYGLRIQDDSAAHAGDAGALEMGLTSESHFTIEIVAPDFDGLSPVQRQQKVYTALSEMMPKIHALSLVTKTPAEVAA